MSKTEIITFGCRLNIFESEIIRGHAEKSGLKDTTIINSCGVTGEAVKQARQKIRRVRRKKPYENIIVTGCAAQISPEIFAGMSEVDHVIGNKEKLQYASYENWSKPQHKVAVKDIMKDKATWPGQVLGFEKNSRAFVQVQQGCDHRCTFCIIPFARGNNVSFPASIIISQVKNLVLSGFKEVVLTGVDICSYGVDFSGKSMLSILIKKILKQVPELKRLRLSSLDPALIDEMFLEVLMTEERLMPHLHFSLQSMDDMILKRMKRRHTSAGVIRLACEARQKRPDVVFGADMIAGFPTENEEMFNNSVEGLKNLGVTFLHVFPFSERKGTPAFKMPPVKFQIRKKRAKRLREIGEKKKRQFYSSLIGTSQQVLIEKNNRGFTEQLALIEIKNFNIQKKVPGDLVKVDIVSFCAGNLVGEIC